MTRQSSSTGQRCRQPCTKANFTAFGSRRTAWPFLRLPSPPGAHGSQREDVRSRAPDLPVALKPDHRAHTATPTFPASTFLSPNPIDPVARQPAGQSNAHCLLLELVSMLDHLVVS